MKKLKKPAHTERAFFEIACGKKSLKILFKNPSKIFQIEFLRFQIDF